MPPPIVKTEMRMILRGQTKELPPGSYMVKGTLIPLTIDSDGCYHIDWVLERVDSVPARQRPETEHPMMCGCAECM